MIYHAAEEITVHQVVDQRTNDGHVSVAGELTPDRIESIEGLLLKLPQVDTPLNHAFAPGVYLRQITMPKGAFVIGHEHKTEHFNVVLSGHASVYMDGLIQEIKAPAIIKSNSGTRKLLFIHDTMIWATIHPTEETNLEKLEEELIVKSETFKVHEKELAAFQALLTEQKESTK
jgi:hypothetical protein